MLRRGFLKNAAGGLAVGALPLSGAWGQDAAATATPIPPREVPIAKGIPAGQIHIMPDDLALYWTLPGARALRYAVGVGRDTLYEVGSFVIQTKKEWPSWTPTPGMLEREPEVYEKWAGGMPGGVDNPLGARALYLFNDGYDTFLRIHGTNRAQTIGTAVSNGCARLVNDQIIDLYEKVPLETRVFLYPKAGQSAGSGHAHG